MATFATNIGIPRTEKIGPNTNNRDVTILHPDLHRSCESGHVDAGQYVRLLRRIYRSTYLPDMNMANIVRKDIVDVDENGIKVRSSEEYRVVELNVFKKEYLKTAYGIPIDTVAEDLPDDAKPLIILTP